MTKIMESDMWQVICLENSGEVCSHETRLDDFTNLIDIDVIKVSQSRRQSVKYGVVLIRHGFMSCAGLSDLQPMVTA